MSYHKFIQRQIRKHLKGLDIESIEGLDKFLMVVSDSYVNFEQDKELSDRAFEMADRDYNEINARLSEEKAKIEEGVRKLLETAADLAEGDGDVEWDENEADLIKVVELLNSQVERRKEVESKLRVAMEKAQGASKAKTEFLSVMSHEIRSPLNVILGMVHIMKQEEHMPSQIENLDVLSITAKNLMLLINDILDFSKIEAGKLELEKNNFSIKELASNVKKANNSPAGEKGNKMRLMIEEGIPDRLIGDGVRLGQVVTNLVSNAVKFTRHGSITIVLELVQKDDEKARICVSVQDTGIGMAPEEQALIFDKFTQANSTTTRKYGGTGLGLAITKSLLDLMGTKIQLESEKGRGSRFFFELELPIGEAVDTAALLRDANSKDLKAAKVLVVDDLPFNIMIVKKIMKPWNVELFTACNGQEAVEKVMKGDFNLILMDLQMPVMGGIEATQEIRKFNKEIPIIALTASSDEGTRQSVINIGMNDYSSKPFVPDDLYAKMKKQLEKPRLKKAS